MSTLGTFDSFNTMRLGIYAAQQGLRVTGNNISNINTKGYTRQRADQVSFKTGGSDRYASMIDKKVGNGVLISGINQIRDPFLDIRYRNASNDTYHLDTWLGGMQDIAAILDEVGKGENKGDGLIYKQLQDLADKLRAYGANPTIENDRLVRQSASSLTDLFHSAANRLDRLYKDTQMDFNNSITAVNEILTNIRDLDKSIREAEIHGDMALELRDERNLQIDKLSQYLDIKVEYSYEDVGSGIQVEKLTIKLNNANPDKNVTSDESILVDGLYCTQLSVPDKKPLVNTYDTSKDAYAYLKGYSYLKTVTADSKEIQERLAQLNEGKEDGDELFTIEDLGLVPVLDEDGKETGAYYWGTNSVDEAVKVDNDNYTLQLSKLLNSKGVEWENSVTTWAAVNNGPSNASFSYKVGVGEEFTADSQFSIGGYPCTIGAATDPDNYTITLEDAKNPEKFAEFVAALLTKSGNYPDYTITSNANGEIIFTAVDEKKGAIGSEGAPEKAPNLQLSDPDNTGWLILGPVQILDNGQQGDPVDPNEKYPQTTYDVYGNKTTVDYVQMGDQWYKVTVETEYTREIALDDNDTRGIIQAQRELLTEEGEFASQADVDLDEQALIKRGIPYYQKSLDLLAQKLAEAYNELNQGYMTDKDGYYIYEDGTQIMVDELVLDEDGNPTFDGNNKPIYTSKPLSSDGPTPGQRKNLIINGNYLKDKDGNPVDKNGNPIIGENGQPITADMVADLSQKDYEKLVVDMNGWLEKNGGVFMGGVLFSNGNNGNDTTGINARNIDISYGWSNGTWNLVPKFEKIFVDEENPDGMDHSTQNKNAARMLALIDRPLTYNPRDLYGSDAIGPELFTGSFNDMFSHMMAVEAEDERSTTVQLNTSATILEDLDYRREGVSGVDLNDEAMNMVQYQKAMNAAMRLMTAIDECLDRLISNTGVAGR